MLEHFPNAFSTEATDICSVLASVNNKLVGVLMLYLKNPHHHQNNNTQKEEGSMSEREKERKREGGMDGWIVF